MRQPVSLQLPRVLVVLCVHQSPVHTYFTLCGKVRNALFSQNQMFFVFLYSSRPFPVKQGHVTRCANGPWGDNVCHFWEETVKAPRGGLLPLSPCFGGQWHSDLPDGSTSSATDSHWQQPAEFPQPSPPLRFVDLAHVQVIKIWDLRAFGYRGITKPILPNAFWNPNPCSYLRLGEFLLLIPKSLNHSPINVRWHNAEITPDQNAYCVCALIVGNVHKDCLWILELWANLTFVLYIFTYLSSFSQCMCIPL